jgi:hypothetical protein
MRHPEYETADRIDLTDDDFATEPPRRRKPVGLRRLMLVLSASGLLAVAMGAIVYLLAFGWSVALEPADESVVIQFEEVEELLGEPLSRDAPLVMDRRRYIDGSFGVSGEYDGIHLDPSVYFMSELTVERTTGAARMVYQGAKLGFSVIPFDADVEWVTDNTVFRWGDESELLLEYYDGDLVGFQFFGRKGRRVYDIMVSGLIVISPEQIADLLRAKMREVDAYRQ